MWTCMRQVVRTGGRLSHTFFTFRPLLVSVSNTGAFRQFHTTRFVSSATSSNSDSSLRGSQTRMDQNQVNAELLNSVRFLREERERKQQQREREPRLSCNTPVIIPFGALVCFGIAAFFILMEQQNIHQSLNRLEKTVDRSLGRLEKNVDDKFTGLEKSVGQDIARLEDKLDGSFARLEDTCDKGFARLEKNVDDLRADIRALTAVVLGTLDAQQTQILMMNARIDKREDVLSSSPRTSITVADPSIEVADPSITVAGPSIEVADPSIKVAD